MVSHEDYARAKTKLLEDSSICKENRELFSEFFAYEEYKLRRKNGLSKLDKASLKTVYEYCSRLRTVNVWFRNKPWRKLTKADIRRVYDALEDGDIKSNRGTRYKNRRTYYVKVFRSKPFELAGKREIAREVMEFYRGTSAEEVRFIDMKDFRRLVETATQPAHKLLMWLAWDIGENVSSLLLLRKRDFVRQMNPDTGEAEYVVNLRKEILKRNRRDRSEITNYEETVGLLDAMLEPLQADDCIVSFGYRQAKKVFDRAVKLTGVKCRPKGQPATWKDLRSSMACHLLREGWSSDEVNSRLGHRPSSRELDKYVNFLALDRHKPKKKLHFSDLQKLKDELDREKSTAKLHSNRIKIQGQELDLLKQEVERLTAAVGQSTKLISKLIRGRPDVQAVSLGQTA